MAFVLGFIILVFRLFQVVFCLLLFKLLVCCCLLLLFVLYDLLGVLCGYCGFTCWWFCACGFAGCFFVVLVVVLFSWFCGIIVVLLCFVCLAIWCCLFYLQLLLCLIWNCG